MQEATKVGVFGWQCPDCQCSVSANVSGSPGMKRCVECKALFTIPAPDTMELTEQLNEAHRILYDVRTTLSLNGLKSNSFIKEALKEVEKAIKHIGEY